MTKNKKKWADLRSTQQKAIMIGAGIELVVTAYAVRDLVQRPRANVRGPKALWGLSFVVQPFGPLAYLAMGRASS